VVTLARCGPPLAVGLALLALSCKPDLNLNDSIVDEARVLGVQAVPAEVQPMSKVKYTVLSANGSGPISNVPIRWDFCEARKPLAELGPVNTECLEASGAWFVPLGDGSQPSGVMPSDACQLFGPDVPPAEPGQPQGRPVDPDPTGGYYEPIRGLATDGTSTIVQTRLTCGLGNAPTSVGVQYTQRYHANTNPAVASLSVVADDAAGAPLVTSDKGDNAASVGAHETLRVAWSPCPMTDVCMDGFCGPDETSMSCPADCTTPLGCSGAERFVGFDIGSQALVDQREAISVAWYTTTGSSFDIGTTGRESSDLAVTSDNGWQAPAAPGRAFVWVVLRDDRGGAGWAEYAFDVK
jgi:hypothetical protein